MVDVAGREIAQFRMDKRLAVSDGCIVKLLRGWKIQSDFPQGMCCEPERIGTSRSQEVARAF
jgi:hypothetical protein